MNSDLEQRLREALHDDAARARLVNPDRPADPDARSLPGAQRPARSSRRLVAAAAAIVLFAVAGTVVWFHNDRDRDVGVTTAPDPDSATVTTESAPTTPEAGGPLDLDAVEEAEEFRVDNVVVTVQCTGTRGSTGSDSERREVILGGEVTDNPDGVAMIDGVNVAVGDLLALIIREDQRSGRRRTLYHPSLWYGEQASAHAGSCNDVVASVPANLDGGFFDIIDSHFDLEIDEPPGSDDGPTTLANGEDVEIADIVGAAGLAGQTLNITAEEQDGEVTGEFRVDNVVVTLRCADTETDGRDLVLGGELTDDPDGNVEAYADLGDLTHGIDVGDLLVLIIRNGDPVDQVALRANEGGAGSCTELVESVPYNLDGGFFNEVEDGEDIETG